MLNGDSVSLVYQDYNVRRIMAIFYVHCEKKSIMLWCVYVRGHNLFDMMVSSSYIQAILA